MKPRGNQFVVAARVTAGSQTSAQGYQVARISAHHPSSRARRSAGCGEGARRQREAEPSVGYVMGVGDEVPAALEQLV
jgi:hypothetical protein